MELDDSAQDLVTQLVDVVICGYANRENWEEGVNGYIRFLERKNADYSKLTEPYKYLFLEQTLVSLAEELRGLCRIYDYMADSMCKYDDEDYELDRCIGGEDGGK